MTETNNKCSSCKEQITNDDGSVLINCPSCGKAKILRCSKCRQLVAQYECPECGFVGPN